LQSVAASTLFVAPAIVRSESLMKIFIPGQRVKFRVPDLRGHFATNPEPMNLPAQREMTATEVLERREEVKTTWAKRWNDHMHEDNARQMMQAAATKAVNEKIDAEIYSQLQGHEITGVWLDESDVVKNQVAYHIEQNTGQVQAFTDHPMGWIPCDGRELSAIEHPNLYMVLGNKYG
jgi:microcystin-dependent protein